jgi:DNA polymerase
MSRNQVVTGKGNPSSFVVIGEAPGADEDLLGEPFVGRCGELLTKMLDDIDISRDTIYVSNTVKCRPTKGRANRPPTKEEIEACKGWIWNELKLIQPKVIVTLGKAPTSLLLKIKQYKLKMADVVGIPQYVDYMESTIIPCYHPSYLMQTGRHKMEASMDALKKAKEIGYNKRLF